MTPWLEILSVMTFALIGIAVGTRLSNLPRERWLIAYPVLLGFVTLLFVLRFTPAAFTPVLAPLLLGKARYILGAFLTTILLTAPFAHLRLRVQRLALAVLMTAVIAQVCLWPLVSHAVARPQLASLQTKLDANGVCRQTTDFSCGPAAAVTALLRLGLPAEEGNIALLARTSPSTGTEPDVLAEGLRQHYRKEGLICEYRKCREISELASNRLAVVSVKTEFLKGHFVVVLGVTNGMVEVADPQAGLLRVPEAFFKEVWDQSAVLLRLGPVPKPGV